MFLRKIILLLVFNAVIIPLLIGSVEAQSPVPLRRTKMPAGDRWSKTQTDHTSKNEGQRPRPPRRIPPNKVKPGGGLSFSQQSCGNPHSSLTALIPINNPVLTTQSHPSFLFYIPDPASAIAYGEFSLFTAEEKTRVYTTKINLQNTPGIIKIDLPNTEQNALAEQPYHWYFKVYCQNTLNSALLLDVDGWIERVPLTPSRAAQIETASPEIWYDALATTAQNLLSQPEDMAVRDRWLKLLQFINREYLVDMNIQSVNTTTITTDLSQGGDNQ